MQDPMSVTKNRGIKECPQCKEEFNESSRRPVQDTCGHYKCRRCLILNEECVECSNVPGGPPTGEVSSIRRYSHRNCNGNGSTGNTGVVNLNNINGSVEFQNNPNHGPSNQSQHPLELGSNININPVPITEIASSSTEAMYSGTQNPEGEYSILDLDNPLLHSTSYEAIISQESEFSRSLMNLRAEADSQAINTNGLDNGSNNNFLATDNTNSTANEQETASSSANQTVQCPTINYSDIDIDPTPEVSESTEAETPPDPSPQQGSKASRAKTRKRNPVIIPEHITVIPGDPKKYHCKVCDKKFKTKAHNKYHEFCVIGRRPFECKKCGQGFIAKSHYEYHLRTHTGERPYKCPQCGKGFNQQGKVTRHMKSHTGERPFVCTECGRGFANSQALRSHNMVHTGERPFSCKYCQKRFTGLTNLKKHLITHTGERPFGCTHCGKCFGLKWTLDLHLRTHSKERPYVCQECSRGFSSSKDLRRHLVIHTGERPFKCWICDTRFRRKDNLDRHVKNQHQEPKEDSQELEKQAGADSRAKKKLAPVPMSKVNFHVVTNVIEAAELPPVHVENLAVSPETNTSNMQVIITAVLSPRRSTISEVNECESYEEEPESGDELVIVMNVSPTPEANSALEGPKDLPSSQHFVDKQNSGLSTDIEMSEINSPAENSENTMEEKAIRPNSPTQPDSKGDCPTEIEGEAQVTNLAFSPDEESDPDITADLKSGELQEAQNEGGGPENEGHDHIDKTPCPIQTTDPSELKSGDREEPNDRDGGAQNLDRNIPTLSPIMSVQFNPIAEISEKPREIANSKDRIEDFDRSEKDMKVSEEETGCNPLANSPGFLEEENPSEVLEDHRILLVSMINRIIEETGEVISGNREAAIDDAAENDGHSFCVTLSPIHSIGRVAEETAELEAGDEGEEGKKSEEEKVESVAERKKTEVEISNRDEEEKGAKSKELVCQSEPVPKTKVRCTKKRTKSAPIPKIENSYDSIPIPVLNIFLDPKEAFAVMPEDDDLYEVPKKRTKSSRKEDKRPFKCRFCATTFRKKENLDRHIEEKHKVTEEAVARYFAVNKNAPVNTSKINSGVMANTIVTPRFPQAAARSLDQIAEDRAELKSGELENANSESRDDATTSPIQAIEENSEKPHETESKESEMKDFERGEISAEVFEEEKGCSLMGECQEFPEKVESLEVLEDHRALAVSIIDQIVEETGKVEQVRDEVGRSENDGVESNPTTNSPLHFQSVEQIPGETAELKSGDHEKANIQGSERDAFNDTTPKSNQSVEDGKLDDSRKIHSLKPVGEVEFVERTVKEVLTEAVKDLPSVPLGELDDGSVEMQDACQQTDADTTTGCKILIGRPVSISLKIPGREDRATTTESVGQVGEKAYDGNLVDEDVPFTPYPKTPEKSMITSANTLDGNGRDEPGESSPKSTDMDTPHADGENTVSSTVSVLDTTTAPFNMDTELADRDVPIAKTLDVDLANTDEPNNFFAKASDVDLEEEEAPTTPGVKCTDLALEDRDDSNESLTKDSVVVVEDKEAFITNLFKALKINPDPNDSNQPLAKSPDVELSDPNEIIATSTTAMDINHVESYITITTSPTAPEVSPTDQDDSCSAERAPAYSQEEQESYNQPSEIQHVNPNHLANMVNGGPLNGVDILCAAAKATDADLINSDESINPAPIPLDVGLPNKEDFSQSSTNAANVHSDVTPPGESNVPNGVHFYYLQNGRESEAYHPSQIQIVYPDNMTSVENVGAYYASATAIAERNDDASGPPIKIRLMLAEVFGEVGSGTDASNKGIIYSSTVPNQTVNPTSPRVELDPPSLHFETNPGNTEVEGLQYSYEPRTEVISPVQYPVGIVLYQNGVTTQFPAQTNATIPVERANDVPPPNYSQGSPSFNSSEHQDAVDHPDVPMDLSLKGGRLQNNLESGHESLWMLATEADKKDRAGPVVDQDHLWSHSEAAIQAAAAIAAVGEASRKQRLAECAARNAERERRRNLLHGISPKEESADQNSSSKDQDQALYFQYRRRRLWNRETWDPWKHYLSKGFSRD